MEIVLSEAVHERIKKNVPYLAQVLTATADHHIGYRFSGKDPYVSTREIFDGDENVIGKIRMSTENDTTRVEEV